MSSTRKIQMIENVESPEFGSDLINGLDEIQTEHQVSQNLAHERRNLRQLAYAGDRLQRSVSPVSKRNEIARRGDRGPAWGLVIKKYRHVRPRRMYPWSFFRSSVVLLAAVHWHSLRSVKSGIHCQGPPVLLNGVGAVTRFTYGNRHASPRRTPLLSPWVLLRSDFPPPLSRAFVISDGRAR